jgi:response regulator NasT
MDKALKVLIAEDEAIIALSLEINVERLGHKVIGRAKNGPEAVKLANELKPDLILMDIKMPEFSGIRAAEKIMDVRPVPIIFLTAYAEPDLVDSAVSAGALVYLVKPISEADLLPAIRLALRRFQESQVMNKEITTLKEALEVRRVVEQAKGILMERLGIDADTAFRMLSEKSQRENRRVTEVSREIIEKG